MFMIAVPECLNRARPHLSLQADQRHASHFGSRGSRSVTAESDRCRPPALQCPDTSGADLRLHDEGCRLTMPPSFRQRRALAVAGRRHRHHVPNATGTTPPHHYLFRVHRRSPDKLLIVRRPPGSASDNNRQIADMDCRPDARRGQGTQSWIAP